MARVAAKRRAPSRATAAGRQPGARKGASSAKRGGAAARAQMPAHEERKRRRKARKVGIDTIRAAVEDAIKARDLEVTPTSTLAALLAMLADHACAVDVVQLPFALDFLSSTLVTVPAPTLWAKRALIIHTAGGCLSHRHKSADTSRESTAAALSRKVFGVVRLLLRLTAAPPDVTLLSALTSLAPDPSAARTYAQYASTLAAYCATALPPSLRTVEAEKAGVATTTDALGDANGDDQDDDAMSGGDARKRGGARKGGSGASTVQRVGGGWIVPSKDSTHSVVCFGSLFAASSTGGEDREEVPVVAGGGMADEGVGNAATAAFESVRGKVAEMVGDMLRAVAELPRRTAPRMTRQGRNGVVADDSVSVGVGGGVDAADVELPEAVEVGSAVCTLAAHAVLARVAVVGVDRHTGASLATVATGAEKAIEVATSLAEEVDSILRNPRLSTAWKAAADVAATLFVSVTVAHRLVAMAQLASTGTTADGAPPSPAPPVAPFSALILTLEAVRAESVDAGTCAERALGAALWAFRAAQILPLLPMQPPTPAEAEVLVGEADALDLAARVASTTAAGGGGGSGASVVGAWKSNQRRIQQAQKGARKAMAAASEVSSAAERWLWLRPLLLRYSCGESVLTFTQVIGPMIAAARNEVTKAAKAGLLRNARYWVGIEDQLWALAPAFFKFGCGDVVAAGASGVAGGAPPTASQAVVGLIRAAIERVTKSPFEGLFSHTSADAPDGAEGDASMGDGRTATGPTLALGPEEASVQRNVLRALALLAASTRSLTRVGLAATAASAFLETRGGGKGGADEDGEDDDDAVSVATTAAAMMEASPDMLRSIPTVLQSAMPEQVWEWLTECSNVAPSVAHCVPSSTADAAAAALGASVASPLVQRVCNMLEKAPPARRPVLAHVLRMWVQIAKPATVATVVKVPVEAVIKDLDAAVATAQASAADATASPGGRGGGRGRGRVGGRAGRGRGLRRGSVLPSSATATADAGADGEMGEGAAPAESAAVEVPPRAQAMMTVLSSVCGPAVAERVRFDAARAAGLVRLPSLPPSILADSTTVAMVWGVVSRVVKLKVAKAATHRRAYSLLAEVVLPTVALSAALSPSTGASATATSAAAGAAWDGAGVGSLPTLSEFVDVVLQAAPFTHEAARRARLRLLKAMVQTCPLEVRDDAAAAAGSGGATRGPAGWVVAVLAEPMYAQGDLSAAAKRQGFGVLDAVAARVKAAGGAADMRDARLSSAGFRGAVNLGFGEGASGAGTGMSESAGSSSRFGGAPMSAADQVLTAAVAGLGGFRPAMVAGTVTSLARLLWCGVGSPGLQAGICKAVVRLMSHKSSTVATAATSFVRTIVRLGKGDAHFYEIVRSLLPVIAQGVLSWSTGDGTTAASRLRGRLLVEKLFTQFGVSEVAAAFPSDADTFVRGVERQWRRVQRAKAAEKGLPPPPTGRSARGGSVVGSVAPSLSAQLIAKRLGGAGAPSGVTGGGKSVVSGAGGRGVRVASAADAAFDRAYFKSDAARAARRKALLEGAAAAAVGGGGGLARSTLRMFDDDEDGTGGTSGQSRARYGSAAASVARGRRVGAIVDSDDEDGGRGGGGGDVTFDEERQKVVVSAPDPLSFQPLKRRRAMSGVSGASGLVGAVGGSVAAPGAAAARASGVGSRVASRRGGPASGVGRASGRGGAVSSVAVGRLQSRTVDDALAAVAQAPSAKRAPGGARSGVGSALGAPGARGRAAAAGWISRATARKTAPQQGVISGSHFEGRGGGDVANTGGIAPFAYVPLSGKYMHSKSRSVMGKALSELSGSVKMLLLVLSCSLSAVHGLQDVLCFLGMPCRVVVHCVG